MATREGHIHLVQGNRLLRKSSLNANGLSVQWELREGILCISLSSVFLYGVIHCLTLVNLFELFLMTGVIGAHLSVIFAGLIMFQRHLEHESLVHYESGILHGIVRHQSFLTTLACGHLKMNGH